MPPTTSSLVDVRLKKDGVELPGVYTVRVTFRDKLFITDQCLAQHRGVFERAYEMAERCLVRAVDVPGVVWGSSIEANLEALGRDRLYLLAVELTAFTKLTEDERKN